MGRGVCCVGCNAEDSLNSGIPREFITSNTGSANSVRKNLQPFSIPFSPNFSEFFPDFVFFPENVVFGR